MKRDKNEAIHLIHERLDAEKDMNWTNGDPTDSYNGRHSDTIRLVHYQTYNRTTDLYVVTISQSWYSSELDQLAWRLSAEWNMETTEVDRLDDDECQTSLQFYAAAERLVGHVQIVEVDAQWRSFHRVGNSEAHRRRILGYKQFINFNKILMIMWDILTCVYVMLVHHALSQRYTRTNLTPITEQNDDFSNGKLSSECWQSGFLM